MANSEKPYSEFGYKLYYLAKPILERLFRIEVEGIENIPKNEGVIIAANHRSYLDPPVLNLVSPKPIIFLAKYDLFKVPLLSWLIKKAGAMPLYGNRKDIKTLKRAIEYLREGYYIGIFPEGTRMEPKKFGKAHSGVGLIAIKSKAKVVPTYLDGTDDVLPVGKSFPTLFKYKIKVKFGKPIDFSDWEDTKENHQKVANIIMENIKALANYKEV